jgi:T4 bacteriophage base plate protein
MRPLSAQDILQLWETGQHQHPIDRALTMLLGAFPDKSLDELANLSVGQRDGCLLMLRELTFGSKLEGIAECPNCGERLEFVMNVSDVQVNDSAGSLASTEFNLTLEDFDLQVRLPTSRDLAAIAHCTELETARSLLAQRCLHQVSQSGMMLEAIALPPTILTQLADRLTEHDPQAEIWLDFSCPSCQHNWKLLFDIVTFFWTELSAQAKRLMQEVYTLARFYGWREADILSMSSVRRQAYLEMVG